MITEPLKQPWTLSKLWPLATHTSQTHHAKLCLNSTLILASGASLGQMTSVFCHGPKDPIFSILNAERKKRSKNVSNNKWFIIYVWDNFLTLY